MSKKNLARTALEGGRATPNKWDRRHSNAEERRSSRDYCNKVKLDPEYALEDTVEVRSKVYQEFSDKLNPMNRWLKSKVGQPWADVRSEVFKKFDSRTTAGRHILFDHLLSSVVDTQSGFNEYGFIADPKEAALQQSDSKYRRDFHEYFVNKEGILCHNEDRFTTYERITEAEYRAVGEWLNGRMIMEKGGVLYWCYPTEGLWKSSWHEPGQPFGYKEIKLKYYLFDNGLHDIPGLAGWLKTDQYTGKIHSDYWNPIEKPFSFKQRGTLSKEEAEDFRLIKEKIRKEILEFTKDR